MITGNHLGYLAKIPLLTNHVIAALDECWSAVRREFSCVPLRLWNESVFRFFFIRELTRLRPQVRCQIEWKGFDLLVQEGTESAVVEFKFYVYAKGSSLNGVWRKGGPGKPNLGEFIECVSKLESTDGENGSLHGRYLVLVYADDPRFKGRQYREWYGQDLTLPSGTLRHLNFNRLHRLPPIRCETTGHALHGWLAALEDPSIDRANPFKLDRTALSFADLSDEGDEQAYWLRRTPLERMQAIEYLRQNAYGTAGTQSAFPRFLEFAEPESG